MKNIFLWPEPMPLNPRHFLGKTIRIEEIESQLHELFPCAEPVLFSSARAGLTSILDQLGYIRSDLVWCPPFSSHCVFDSISRIATPITLPVPGIRAAVIYHQWGYLHTHGFQSDVEIIEDAVDTLFAPGANIFAVGGRFALWSLPKTVASQFGGVVFCRDRRDADALKLLRNRRCTDPTLQAILRVLSRYMPIAATYWHGAEANSGPLPNFALLQIAERLKQLESLTQIHQARTKLVTPYSVFADYDMERLPSNIPVAPSRTTQTLFETDGYFSAGLRNINLKRSAEPNEWTKVAPIAIHAGVDAVVLANVVALLGQESETL